MIGASITIEKKIRERYGGFVFTTIHVEWIEGQHGSVTCLVVSLGADNVCLLFLLGLLDKETRTLRLLLGHLLQLDGLRELLRHSHIQNN